MGLFLVMVLGVPSYQEYIKRANPFGKPDPSTAKPEQDSIAPGSDPLGLYQQIPTQPTQTTNNGAFGENDKPAPEQFDTSTAKTVLKTDWGKGDMQQQTLLDVSAQVVRDYPYLDTPAGKAALGMIINERNERIARGLLPAVALREAADLIAPAHRPQMQTPQRPAKIESSPSYAAMVADVTARVKSGEIPIIEGSTSKTAPVYGDEWSMNDTVTLESNQIWWTTNSGISAGSIFIFLPNPTKKELTGAALEYQGRSCEKSAMVNRFYLTLDKPIPPGGRAVVNLRTEFPIETKGMSCLVVKMAWK